MDGPKTNEEKILDKYYAELPPEEEESGIKYQIKLSAEKYFEFEQAFKLVAGKDESIDREQVSEVFETLGFGFEEWHLDKLLEECVLDREGRYTCEVLVEVYEKWSTEQIQIKDLFTAFNMLKDFGQFLDKLPKSEDRDPEKEQIESIELEEGIVIFQHLLNDILCTDPTKPVTREEAIGVIEELSSSSDGQITFADFVRLFST